MNWEVPHTAGGTMKIFTEKTPLELGFAYS